MKKKKLLCGLSLVVGFSFASLAFADNAEAAEMHRLYNPNSGEHFYTANVGEKNNLVRVGWKSEGIGWIAPSSGNPVYRLYNPNAGDHHYTLNLGEKNHLVKVGWRYEGVGWYSDTKKSVKLYRAYNPNAKSGSHNYTVNYGEQKNLLRVGWRDEGVAWYGITKNNPAPKPPAVQKFTITVKHVGSDGKTLKSSTASVEKGKKYTANSASFSGYTLKGNKSQTITVSKNQTITFNYTKNATPAPTKFTVSVQYKEAGGKLLTATIDKHSVEKGKQFTASAKTFDSYTLKGAKTQTVTVNKDTMITFEYTFNQPNKTELQNLYNQLKNTAKGNYTEESWNNFQLALTVAKAALDNNVTQDYVNRVKNELQQAYNNLKTTTPVQKFNVVVVHKGNDGKTLQTENAVQVEKGKQYTAYSKEFTGYTLEGNNSQTITVNGNAAITFNYTVKTQMGTLTDSEAVVARNTIISEVNKLRSSKGLQPVQENTLLSKAAQIRAKEINEVFDHIRPNNTMYSTVTADVGLKTGGLGENIAYVVTTTPDGKTAGEILYKKWEKSPAHYSLMINSDMKYIGVGVYGYGYNLNGSQLFTTKIY